MTDSEFVKQFSIVLGILVVFVVLVFILANALQSDAMTNAHLDGLNHFGEQPTFDAYRRFVA